MLRMNARLQHAVQQYVSMQHLRFGAVITGPGARTSPSPENALADPYITIQAEAVSKRCPLRQQTSQKLRGVLRGRHHGYCTDSRMTSNTKHMHRPAASARRSLQHTACEVDGTFPKQQPAGHYAVCYRDITQRAANAISYMPLKPMRLH